MDNKRSGHDDAPVAGASGGARSAYTPLSGGEVSSFCEGIAIMLAAGIQTDEAVHMLSENMGDTPLHRACDEVYRGLVSGRGLAASMRAAGGAGADGAAGDPDPGQGPAAGTGRGAEAPVFPAYAVALVGIGERSGRLENVLRSLAVYYDEEERVFAKLRASIGYPAALLCVMSVILAFTVIGILPVFLGVYDELAGGLAGGSFAAVGAAVAVGWVALVLTLAVTACALVGSAAVRTPRGQARILALLERLPVTRPAMYRLALSRFSAAASAYLASGADSNTAMREALRVVDHPVLHERLERAHDAMVDPARALSLSQAVTEFGVFEPVYARMLAIGSRAGSVDGVLERLSATFFDDAVAQVDRAVDAVEPALAALLTVAVGATLISVMLPLVGMMGAIG